MLEDLNFIKEWCEQNHSGLSGYDVAQAVVRMIDDAIRESAQQGVLKPTKCHVDNHVWIFTSDSSTSEPPLNMKCDCEEFTWEAVKALPSKLL